MLSTEQNDLLLVPYDFTKEADTALAHASGIAKKGSDSVRLLHVINRETRARLKKEGISEEDLKQKLAAIATSNTEQTGVQTSWHAVEGSIFSSIAEDAKASNADLIVLGTHGVSGMQHVLGADVIRILEKCHVPGIVVQQKKIDEDGYNHIVLPIDANRFGKNKISYAVAMARYFNAKVHVYSDFSSDEFIAKAIKNNTAQALETLRKHEIPCEHIAQEDDDEDFDEALVRYAVSNEAELIVISSRPDERNVAGILFGRVEEQIINNEAMIPVLVVNPKQDVSHLSIDISTW
jgi:nucleotide-binding universal stress UspA family protein